MVRRRRTREAWKAAWALAGAVLLLAPGLLAPAAGLLMDARPLPASSVRDADVNGDHVAQSLWGAKRAVSLHHVSLLHRPVWEEGVTGAGITAAVIDTGVDATHPDLRDAVVLWKDFVGDAYGVTRDTPYDDNGHGTHVAAVVAGRGHAQPNPVHAYWLTGARGIAPGVDLIVAKAMDGTGVGRDRTVAEAILWALDPDGDGDLSDGADVINLSIGIQRGSGGATTFLGSETRRAVNLALMRGVPVVVSSGNDGAPGVLEPGDVAGVVTVGAVDRDGAPAAFSNHGPDLDVLAPGVLLSAYPRDLDTRDWARDGYAGMAGTSMAAPVVTGLVALMMDADPALRAKGTDRDRTADAAHVKAVLTAHARPVPGVPGDVQGAGVVDAYATLSALRDTGGGFSWTSLARATGAAVLVAWVLVAGLERADARRRRGTGERPVDFEIVG